MKNKRFKEESFPVKEIIEISSKEIKTIKDKSQEQKLF